MAAFSNLSLSSSGEFGRKNPLISFTSENHARKIREVSSYQSKARQCNQEPPCYSLSLANVLSERKLHNNTQYRFAFLDNSLSIALLHGIIPQSTRDDNLPNSVRHILIRPRATGKTFFGKMWLEFMKGDPDNRLDRTQLKQMYAHLFPSPGEFVCVGLDFSQYFSKRFSEHLRQSINEGLKAAMFPKLVTDSKDPLRILGQFISYLKELNRHAAIFIDNFDHLVSGENDLNSISEFYTAINSAADEIPYCYVTGTSRSVIECALINNFVDLSYDPQWATTFGYTWDSLVSSYQQQLQILCKQHKLDLEGLKQKIDFWKGGYYFSPDSKPTDSVYCLDEIHQFLNDGRFDYFSTKGKDIFKNPRYTREFLSLLSRDSRIIYSIADLKAHKYPPEPVTLRDFHMALLAHGILSIYPCTNNFVELRVPNEICLSAIRFFLGFSDSDPSRNEKIHECILNGNLGQAIRMIYPLYGQLTKWWLVGDAQLPLVETEYQVQQVLFAVLFIQYCRNSNRWQFDSDLTSVDDSKRRDFLIRVKSVPTKYFVITVGIYQKSPDRTINDVIVTKLTQALEYKKTMCMRYTAADDFQMIVVITKPNGELFSVTDSYTEQEAISLTQSQTHDEYTKSVKKARTN